MDKRRCLSDHMTGGKVADAVLRVRFGLRLPSSASLRIRFRLGLPSFASEYFMLASGVAMIARSSWATCDVIDYVDLEG